MSRGQDIAQLWGSQFWPRTGFPANPISKCLSPFSVLRTTDRRRGAAAGYASTQRNDIRPGHCARRKAGKGSHFSGPAFRRSDGRRLARTKTNDLGEYRFEQIPWWGRYTVCADDEQAGFSLFTNRQSNNGHPPEIQLSPEHPKAEFNVYLPPPGGFLHIQLTNQKTGQAIEAMFVEVRLSVDNQLLFSVGCASGQAIVVPPDEDPAAALLN